VKINLYTLIISLVLFLIPTIIFAQTSPNLGTTAKFVIFSSSGAVSNTGTSYLTGDVGTNSGSATGFSSQYVTGTIHATPDSTTDAAANDLDILYNYLDSLTADSQLAEPAQFGKGMVLKPYIYYLNAATTFTDSIYLDAKGNANAMFIFKIDGAFTTSTYSHVFLLNGAKAKNVFWRINGAVYIDEYSIFKGTIVAKTGAITLSTGVVLDGRALTTNGAIGLTSNEANIPLPIQLLNFTAIANNGAIEIKWITASEINNDYYTVEKSIDGLYFETLAIIPSFGNSNQIQNYSAMDIDPCLGISYYRLKQTDFNEDYKYSKIISINFSSAFDIGLNVFPNPVLSDNINVIITGVKATEYLVVLTDMIGRTHYSAMVIADKESYYFTLNNNLTSGMYILTASSSNKHYSKKIVIQ